MIILTNTTDSIVIDLAGEITTNQLKCFSSYRDTTSTDITPGRTVTDTNNTTLVDLVPAPASSTQRIVDYISVFNKDTVNATVYLQFNDNGTLFELFVTTLGPGEKLEYAEGNGFQVFSNAGSQKMSQNQGTNATGTEVSVVTLATDVTNNNVTANTIADVTGLSFPVVATNKYYFRFVVNYTSAATTTGSRWSISGPAAPTLLNFVVTSTLTATTQTTSYGNTAYDTPAAASGSSLTAANIAIIEGFITPSATGTVQLRFASEITNSAIVAKAGSICMYQQI